MKSFLIAIMFFCGLLLNSTTALAQEVNPYKAELSRFFRVLSLLEKNNFSEYKTFVLPVEKEIENGKIVHVKPDGSSYLNELVEKYLKREKKK